MTAFPERRFQCEAGTMCIEFHSKVRECAENDQAGCYHLSKGLMRWMESNSTANSTNIQPTLCRVQNDFGEKTVYEAFNPKAIKNEAGWLSVSTG